MLELKEDVDYTEIVSEAVRLVDHIIERDSIISFDQFSCPYTKNLAKELMREAGEA